METKARTFIKSLIWAVIGLAVMTIVGFVATGSLFTGGTMALINAFIGFVTYGLYERVWVHVSWGRRA
ncbi:MAG: DUF2061 domain-containing protein [Pseudomonadota bacterium]